MLFSRNLLCAGIVLISHGAYAMDKKKANSGSSEGGMPGNVLAVLDEKVHTFTEQPFKVTFTEYQPCDGLDCPFTRADDQRPRKPQPGDEDKCDRCKGRGKVKGGSKVITYTVDNEECLDKGIIPGSQLLSVNGTRVTTMMDAARLITKAKLPIKMTFLCAPNTPFRYTKRGREKSRLLYKQLEARKAVLKQMKVQEVERKKKALEESMKPELKYCKTCCARRINDAAKCPRCPPEQLCSECTNDDGSKKIEQWLFCQACDGSGKVERDTQWVPLDDVGRGRWC
jgi:hypothetical protein